MREPTADDWRTKRRGRQKWRDDLAASVYPVAHQRAHEIAAHVTREVGGVCAVEWGINERADLNGAVCIRWSVETDNRRSFEQRIHAHYLESLGVDSAFLAIRLVEYIRAARA